MPTAKWLNEGENFILGVLLGDTGVPGTLYLGLLKNATEPAEDAVLADFVEPSGYGYARKSLSRGTANWTISADTATYKTEQTFLAQGGDWGDITGYFLGTTLNNSGKALALVWFDSPLSVVDGKGIKVTPKLICA